MRILMLLEGSHEAGHFADDYWVRPEERQHGATEILTHKVLGEGNHTVDTFKLSRFPREPRQYKVPAMVQGDGVKAFQGVQEAKRRDYEGFIMVRDADNKPERLSQMELGIRAAVQEEPELETFPRAVGLAIQMLESWLLADLGAFRQAFGKVPLSALPRDPEALWGKPRDRSSNHPKRVLERHLAEIDRTVGRQTYAELAAAIDIEVLERRCCNGFQPFAQRLREQFSRGTADCPPEQ